MMQYSVSTDFDCHKWKRHIDIRYRYNIFITDFYIHFSGWFGVVVTVLLTSTKVMLCLYLLVLGLVIFGGSTIPISTHAT